MYTNFTKILFVFTSLLLFAERPAIANTDNLLDYNRETAERATQSQDYKPAKNKFVVVESLNVQTERKSGEFKLLPYKQRRNKWGGSVSFGVSQYSPVNYEPDGSAQTFEEHYGDAASKLIELTYTYKRNFESMSAGLEFGAGTFSIASIDTADGVSTLAMQVLRVGVAVDLDAFSDEPRYVPYFTAGGYTVVYDENNSGLGVKGSTLVAPYWTAGIKIQLNRLEQETSRIAYEESGVENTFVFVDARGLIRSSAEQDKYFDSEAALNIGFNVEF